ncbi:hypothetical protein DDE20_00835 [Pararhodobacter oceanensis]|uniref:histidine kinase n=2 Tax=Pararhodobacter oceanensis TaxID=2172121 RepID=A0A2T8HXI7_9RHOB|nr:hypothetical protein DDE20_00835 [Pararhodobacter oceanensis]
MASFDGTHPADWQAEAGMDSNEIPATSLPDGQRNARIAEFDLLSYAISASDIAVFCLDVASGEARVAGAWSKVMGVRLDDEVKKQQEWSRRIHPEDAPGVFELQGDCISGRRAQVRLEYRLRTRDGSEWRWMQSDVAAFERDETGKAVTLIGTQRDITDSKLSELKLTAANIHYETLMAHSPTGVVLVSLDGMAIATNTALQNFLGYTEEELFGTQVEKFVHPEDRQARSDNLEALKEGRVGFFEMDLRYIRADNKVVWGRLYATMARNFEDKPKRFVMHVADITQKRKLVELRKELIALAAHELRTPVTIITGALDLIDVLYPGGPEDKIRTLIDAAKHGGSRLRKMIDDMFDFDRLSVVMTPLALTKSDVVAVIHDAISETVKIRGDKEISVTVVSDDPVIDWPCNSENLRKVFVSLISNSTKFSPIGSEITIAARHVQGGLEILVKDRGKGIPTEHHSEVFSPFWQLDPADTREHQGLGLGLCISQNAVRQMNGELSIEAVDGPGAVFKVFLRDADTAQRDQIS